VNCSLGKTSTQRHGYTILLVLLPKSEISTDNIELATPSTKYILKLLAKVDHYEVPLSNLPTYQLFICCNKMNTNLQRISYYSHC